MIESEDQWLNAFLQDIEPRMRGDVSEDNWHPKHSLNEVLSSPYADLSYIRVYSYDQDEYDMIFSNPMMMLLMETNSLRHVSTLLSRAWYVWMDDMISSFDAKPIIQALQTIRELSPDKIDSYKNYTKSGLRKYEKDFIYKAKLDLVELSEKSTSSEIDSVFLRWRWFFSLSKELGHEDSSPTLDFVTSLLNT